MTDADKAFVGFLALCTVLTITFSFFLSWAIEEIYYDHNKVMPKLLYVLIFVAGFAAVLTLLTHNF